MLSSSAEQQQQSICTPDLSISSLSNIQFQIKMQFPNFLIVGLGLIAGIQAQPVEERGQVVAHLIFHGGPASYELFVPTDGTVVQTSKIVSNMTQSSSLNHLLTRHTDNGISVDTIDTPNYDAISLCTFNTSGPKTLVGSVTPDGLNQITVGPPQPILSVSCRAEWAASHGT